MLLPSPSWFKKFIRVFPPGLRAPLLRLLRKRVETTAQNRHKILLLFSIPSLLALALVLVVFSFQPEAYDININGSSVIVKSEYEDSSLSFSISKAININGRVLDFTKEFPAFGTKYWLFFIREDDYQRIMKSRGSLSRCAVAILGIEDFHQHLTPASQKDLARIEAAGVKRGDAFSIQGRELVFKDGKYRGDVIVSASSDAILIDTMTLNGKQLLP